MGRQIYAAIVDGILGGGVYGLMAVGLTLIFGVLDVINIAQGILVVTGAYLSYVLSVHLHIDLFVGLLVDGAGDVHPSALSSTGRSSGRCAAASGHRCRCWPAMRSRSSSRESSTGSSKPITVQLTSCTRPQPQAVRLLHHLDLRVRVHHGGGPGRSAVLAALPDPLRPQRPGHHPGSDRGPAARDPGEPGRRSDVRHRRRGHSGRRDGLRGHQRRIQSQQRL